jgi:hypothetical protein
MMPLGYMAKRVSKKPDWLEASQVTDIYSVSDCVSESFADYIHYWKHNGYWFFNSPEIIRSLAEENSIQLDGTSLFYYEAYEMEFDGECWRTFAPEKSFPIPINVVAPFRKASEGFDVVTFRARTSPECSPLSCNSLAGKLSTNAHCLFPSLEEAKTLLEDGAFENSEPGPWRIFSVQSVEWP